MSISDDLVAALEPWITSALEDYARALGTMFAEVELYSEDEENLEGWEILLDPDSCPAAALPYLAQYVGERLPIGIEERAAREWIKDAPNQRRGTVESIFFAAQRKLTGDRAVSLRERMEPGGEHEDHIEVVTYTAQTPNAGEVLNELLKVVPADIVLNYNVLAGQQWSDVDRESASWEAVRARYATWGDVASTLSGATTFTRPRS